MREKGEQIGKKSGKTPKPKFFVPEKVLFSNLFRCCEYDKNTFFNKINEIMREDIEENEFYIAERLKTISQKKELQPNDNCHILPDGFRQFVKKCQKHCDSHIRQQNYILAECHRRIIDVKNSVCRNYRRKYRPSNMAYDRQTLDQFMKFVRDYEALSERELNRILDPINVSPSDCGIDASGYTKNQDYVVRFVIQKVFPVVTTRSGGTFISVLLKKDWKKLVYNYSQGRNYTTCVKLVDASKEIIFENRLQSYFDKLRELAAMSDAPADDIGEELLKIYNFITSYHKDSLLSGLRYGKTTISSLWPDPAESNCLDNMDDEKYQYDPIISTHITNYLKRLYSDLPDNANHMKKVGKVIEIVRDPILRRIDILFTFDEFRNYQKKGFSENSLFLWDGNQDLRRILIDALRSEQLG